MGDIPAERLRQFDLISKATTITLRWAVDNSIPLLRIEPVVPFVETDFSMYAWFFFDTEASVDLFRSDGTGDRVVARFCSDLSACGYPAEWLSLVVCDFASKEIVDRNYQGSYFYFLR